MLLGFLRGLITLALLAAFFVWLVITNYYAADNGSTDILINSSGGPLAVGTFKHFDLYSHNVTALSVQMIGALATLCFVWYADRTSARSVAWVSFFCATLFACSWLASHSWFIADGVYTRDAGSIYTSYTLACETSFKSTTGVSNERAGDKNTNLCNVVRGGAALSVIVGILQGAMIVYSLLQLVVVGKTASDVSQGVIRTVGLISMMLALVGQLLRGAASLRVAQVAGPADALILAFSFFGGSVAPGVVESKQDTSGDDYLTIVNVTNYYASYAIHLQTLATVVAYACLVHCTKSPSEVPPATDKPTSRRVTAIVGFVVAFFTAGFTITTMIWDARIVNEDAYGAGTKLCGSNGNCHAYRAGIAGEVIMAAAALFIFILFFMALKAAMSGDEPGDRSKIHGLFILASFLALVGLCVIWIIANFITASTYNSKVIRKLNLYNHFFFIAAAFWCTLAFSAYVYWYYSSKNAAVNFGAFFGTLSLCFGWVVTQYLLVRTAGAGGSIHTEACNGKSKTFESDGSNKECQMAVGPAVISWLFGIGEAGVAAMFFLIVLNWLVRGNKEDGATSIWQKLLFLSTLASLVGFFLWNVVQFKAIPEGATSADGFFAIWAGHTVLLVLTVLSTFGTGFVSMAKDNNAVSRSASIVAVLCAATIILGWIAIPAASYWIEKGTPAICSGSGDGSSLCQSSRTGVAGLYIFVISTSVSTGLSTLIALTNKPAAPK